MSSKTVSKIIRIDGMTCVNCENKIERELSATEGIISAKVSYSTGKADVTFNPDIISLEKIEGIIERLDYHVFKENEIAVKSKEIKKKGNSRNNTSNLIGIVIIIFAAYLLISRLGFFNIFNAFPTAKANMGFGMLFLIGLLTSIHCVAMCGGICLSQCVPKDKEAGAAGKRFSSLRPSLLYNTGRVISYTIIGGIVGAIGSVISFSGAMRGIVQIVAGVFMIIMGLNMLNVLPWLRRFNPRMPKIFGKKIYALRESNSPFFIGLLNGLMPCGPLQAMQLYALSTGSMFAGAFSMFLFSVGTVPLMFVFGTISSLLSKKFTNKMMTVSAFLVIILGLFMFNNGTSLSGIAVPSIPIVKTSASTAVKTAAKSGGVAVIKDGVQTVTTTLSPNSYSPIVVQKGIPVKWTIQASSGSINGCNGTMIIQKFNIQKSLQAGDNVIEFTPTDSGVIPYSCWMGMIRSKIIVVDDISKSGATAADGSSGIDNLLQNSIPTDKLAIAKITDGVQHVDITLDKKGFSPAVVVMQKGIETKWTINGKNLDSSNSTVLFPLYYAQLPMKEGANIVSLSPDQDFEFSTSDEAYFGYVKVVDDINKIDEAAIKKEVKAYVPQGSGSSGGMPCCQGQSQTN